MAVSEEADSLYELRQQERADGERERKRWSAAGPGYSETETVYVIEYRKHGDPTWFGCSPFFEPLRLRPEETHSRAEAEEVAALIKQDRHPVSKNATEYSIEAVRVIERTATAKIIAQIS